MFRCVVCVALVVVFAATVRGEPAKLEQYPLLHPRACLAGNWGDRKVGEWRVQLAVHSDRAAADRAVAMLEKRGVASTVYFAAWLVGRAGVDDEPLAVVSNQAFPSLLTARVFAADLQKSRGVAAVPRFFTFYR